MNRRTGGPYVYPRLSSTVEGGRVGFASGLLFLAGIWLTMAPFVLDYEHTGAGFNGRWNDVIVGITIAVLALARILAPPNLTWFNSVTAVLGGWLMIAPLALRYNAGADATTAVANDLAVGGLIVLLALLSIPGRRSSRQPDMAQGGERDDSPTDE